MIEGCYTWDVSNNQESRIDKFISPRSDLQTKVGKNVTDLQHNHKTKITALKDHFLTRSYESPILGSHD